MHSQNKSRYIQKVNTAENFEWAYPYNNDHKNHQMHAKHVTHEVISRSAFRRSKHFVFGGKNDMSRTPFVGYSRVLRIDENGRER